jgi:hypothetical protein
MSRQVDRLREYALGRSGSRDTVRTCRQPWPFFSSGEATTDDDLIRVAGARWAIEDCFQTSAEKTEPTSARRRIAELETELAFHRRATELPKAVVRPKDMFAGITTMAQEGLPIQMACRILRVSESGFHAGAAGLRLLARCGTPG